MTDSIKRYRLQIDSTHGSLIIAPFADSTKRGTLRYVRESPAQATVDRLWDADSLHVQLRRTEEKKFVLLSRGYRWINEFSYNR